MAAVSVKRSSFCCLFYGALVSSHSCQTLREVLQDRLDPVTQEVQENWQDIHYTVSLHIIVNFIEAIKALFIVFQIKQLKIHVLRCKYSTWLSRIQKKKGRMVMKIGAFAGCT